VIIDRDLMIYAVLKSSYDIPGCFYVKHKLLIISITIIITMFRDYCCKSVNIPTDDIIRRKLLIEGDGGNDDRRINSLLKTFIKWCQSSESAEERFLVCILLCQ